MRSRMTVMLKHNLLAGGQYQLPLQSNSSCLEMHMRISGYCVGLFAIVCCQSVAFAQKAALNDSVERRGDETWQIARQIWQFAEPGYQETQSAKLLADTLERAGFVV